MEILCSVVVGAAAGGLAAVVCRSVNIGLMTCVAVGILGGLLGLASDFWLDVSISAYLASGVGAFMTLLLWIVAQRSLVSNSPESVTNDVG